MLLDAMGPTGHERPLLRYLGLLAVLALACSVSFCGPSLRRTYQSDTAFVRCFDLDSDPSVAPGAKNACWTTWLDRYVYNQYDDKIQHARKRIAALGRGASGQTVDAGEAEPIAPPPNGPDAGAADASPRAR